MEQNIIPEGYKKTEVGVIPDDWVAVKFGDIVTLRNERINPQIKGYSNFCIELEHIDKVKGLLNGHTVTTKKSSIKNLFKKNDVLFGKLRSYLRKYYYAQERGSCSTEIWVFRAVDSLLNSGYLNQIIRTDNFIECSSASSGTHMPRSEWGVVKQLILPLPKDIKEQTAIANALSDVDALIASIEKLIVKKQAIKTATMQQLLTGKKRLPSFDTYQKTDLAVIQGDKQIGQRKGTQQTELGEIPEDWEVMTLAEIANIQRGASPRPIEDPIWFSRVSNVGWLRISDVSKANKFLFETKQNLSEKGISQSRYVEPNSLVMSICATVGRPILTRKKLCIHDGFVLFSKLKAEIEYLYYVLTKLEPEWGKQGQTGSQMNLNTELINSTSISLPISQLEQLAISQILSDMDIELSQLNKRLTKTQQIKQGMMQELLTGKTRLL